MQTIYQSKYIRMIINILNKFKYPAIMTTTNNDKGITSFQPSEKFLQVSIAEKIQDVNKSVPYYPLPSNEGYEKFLQSMKKDQCKKDYLIRFLINYYR